jgi:hypothetical protein
LLIYSTLQYLPSILAKPLQILGRVPLFFYLLHLYLLHFLGLVALGLRDGQVSLTHNVFVNDAVGWSLGLVYLAWIVVVLALYFPSRWFAAVKERRRNWWLSYL